MIFPLFVFTDARRLPRTHMLEVIVNVKFDMSLTQ